MGPVLSKISCGLTHMTKPMISFRREGWGWYWIHFNHIKKPHCSSVCQFTVLIWNGCTLKIKRVLQSCESAAWQTALWQGQRCFCCIWQTSATTKMSICWSKEKLSTANLIMNELENLKKGKAKSLQPHWQLWEAVLRGTMLLWAKCNQHARRGFRPQMIITPIMRSTVKLQQ